MDMPIILISDRKRIDMNELNQNLAENLGTFLMGFRDEVIKGLEDYLILKTTSLIPETV